MSDTPRTDKEMMQGDGGMWYIRPAFARELERELNALKGIPHWTRNEAGIYRTTNHK